jgi:hypothetical protein
VPSNNFAGNHEMEIAWSDGEEVSLEEVGCTSGGVTVGKASLDEWDVVTLN